MRIEVVTSRLRRAAIFAVTASVLAAGCTSNSELSADTADAPTPVEPGPEDGNPEPPSIDRETNATHFGVRGSDIVDPSGNVFVPVGANVGPPLRDAEGKPVWHLTYQGDDITDHVGDVKAWGWNTLRLTSSCIGGDTTESNAAYGTPEELAAIDEVVETYTAEAIVVIIDCHGLTGADPQIGSDTYDKTVAFWEAAADRYRDNPYVWFNHLNEFSAGREPADIIYWQSIVDDGYRIFQEAGSENLLVFDVPGFGQHIGVFDDPTMLDWSRQFCNSVWSWHSYGALDGVIDITKPGNSEINGLVETQLVALKANDVPVLIGEIGYDWNSDRKESNSVSWEVERDGALAALEHAPEHGYGVLAWHANGDSADAMRYGLKASDSLIFSQPGPDTELSELGTLFWDYSQKQREAPAQQATEAETCRRSAGTSG